MQDLNLACACFSWEKDDVRWVSSCVCVRERERVAADPVSKHIGRDETRGEGGDADLVKLLADIDKLRNVEIVNADSLLLV